MIFKILQSKRFVRLWVKNKCHCNISLHSVIGPSYFHSKIYLLRDIDSHSIICHLFIKGYWFACNHCNVIFWFILWQIIFACKVIFWCIFSWWRHRSYPPAVFCDNKKTNVNKWHKSMGDGFRLRQRQDLTSIHSVFCWMVSKIFKYKYRSNMFKSYRCRVEQWR